MRKMKEIIEGTLIALALSVVVVSGLIMLTG